MAVESSVGWVGISIGWQCRIRYKDEVGWSNVGWRMACIVFWKCVYNWAEYVTTLTIGAFLILDFEMCTSWIALQLVFCTMTVGDQWQLSELWPERFHGHLTNLADGGGGNYVWCAGPWLAYNPPVQKATSVPWPGVCRGELPDSTAILIQHLILPYPTPSYTGF